MKYVYRLLPFGRDQHQIDIDAVLRDDAADPVQQPRRILGHQLEDGVAPRMLVVEINHRRAPCGTAAEQHALLFARQQGRHVILPGHDVGESPIELLARLRIALEELLAVAELEHVEH